MCKFDTLLKPLIEIRIYYKSTYGTFSVHSFEQKVITEKKLLKILKSTKKQNMGIVSY